MLTKRTKAIIFIILVSFFNSGALADEMSLVGTWTYKGVGCVGTDTLPSSLPESEFYPQTYNDRITFNSDNTLVEEGFTSLYEPYICSKSDFRAEYTVNGNSIQKKAVDLQVHKESCTTNSGESLKAEDLDKLAPLIEESKKKKGALVVELGFEISGDTLYLIVDGSILCKDRFVAAYTRLK